MCKSNDLTILNGRFGENTTGKDRGVVDYFIGSIDVIKYISNMKILEHSTLYSDVHKPITLELKSKQPDITSSNNCLNGIDDYVIKIKHWEKSKEPTFLELIDRSAVDKIMNKLEHMEETATEIDINEVTNMLNNTFLNAAKETFGEMKVKQNKIKNLKNETKNLKPWFSKECKEARKLYRKRKRIYSHAKTVTAERNLKLSEKSYKKTMNEEIAKHRKEMKKKMKIMKTADPRQYWNILNKGQSSGTHSNISIDTLFEFFKTLNKKPESEPNPENITQENGPDVVRLNHELNNSITQDEILKCIKSLQNNKANGDDELINEYIKTTSNIFIPIYEKLFNFIFNSGIMPECWLIGNIIPIYKNKGDKQDPKNYRPITILSCVGKLFTALLNNRLSKFSDDFKIIKENQTGFRKIYSTTDNNFYLCYSYFIRTST